jgi:hypothetical protein
MERNKDIRWIQRLSNYCRSLSQLEAAVALAKQRPLSALEQQGMVHSFENTHELSWNVLRDYYPSGDVFLNLLNNNINNINMNTLLALLTLGPGYIPRFPLFLWKLNFSRPSLLAEAKDQCPALSHT